jgi:hydrogenase nickel incorporation protein HypB
MCGICGCSDTQSKTKGFFKPAEIHHQGVMNVHRHTHHHDTHSERMIQVEQDILSKNNGYAAQNRQHFQQHKIFALNFVSSPGAGKTTLLVETIKLLKEQINIAVIEGDQQTEHDADRIRATGTKALQINTGKACHLDAHDIGHAVLDLQVVDGSFLAIENVGNLVCPSSFDLGEAHKVVVLSVTEGDDKPLKYPDMFHAADLMIINKMDLLPYVNFDVARCIEFAKRINPAIQVLQLSATRPDSLTDWTSWITNQMGLLEKPL